MQPLYASTAPLDVPAYLALFEDAAGAAVTMEALLKTSPGPATGLLEWLGGGIRLHAETTPFERRPLTEEERELLDAPGTTWGHERHGRLVTRDGIAAAAIRLLLVMDRIPERARQLLEDSDLPAGAILETYGLTRVWRRAIALPARPGQAAVRSSAVLVVGGQRCGIAWEEIPYEFCELAARALRPSST